MSTCQSCGASIVWAETPSGRRQPLDRQPVADGIRLLVGRGLNRAPLVIPSDWLDDHHPNVGEHPELLKDALYMPHHASCPKADEWRGKTRKDRADA